jgi:DNA-directed RNA polymerase specialized sigma subunit
MANNSVIKQYIRDINSILDVIVEKDSRDIIQIFNALIKKEEEFAKFLTSRGAGRKLYEEFTRHVIKSKGGINTGKTYFRLREIDAVATVNSSIKSHQLGKLYLAPINYNFCCFIMGKILGKYKDLDVMFKEICFLRDEIITRHLYLSLNQAKVFGSGSFTGNSLEDLIQIANEALISAVDKYVINEDSSTFQQMAIGKMLAAMIEKGYVYSSAHFGPMAKKKIYNIRRVIQANPEFNTADISKVLGIAEEEIDALISASASMEVALDKPLKDIDNKKFSDIIADNDSAAGTNNFEEDDALKTMSNCFRKLTLLEQKVLRLKGVKIDEESEFACSN